MARNTLSTGRDKVLENLRFYEKARAIDRGLASGVRSFSKRAEDEKLGIVIELLLNNPFRDPNGNRYTTDTFTATPYLEQQQAIQNAWAVMGPEIRRLAIDPLKSVDVFKESDGSYSPQLAKIGVRGVNTLIQEAGEERIQRLLSMARDFITYETVLDDLTKGRPLEIDAETQKNLYNNAVFSSAYEFAKRHLKMDDNQAQAYAALQRLQPSETVDRSKFEKAAREERDRKAKILENDPNFGKAYRSKVSEYVIQGLRELLDSGDANKELAAADMVYKAYEGHSLDRKFDETFPPKKSP